MRGKYDTSVIFLYAIGKEQLLPYEFRRQIPYSTIAGWRSADCSQYIGHEFRYFFDEAFDKAELNFRYHRIKKATMSFAKAWITLSYALIPLIKNAAGNRELQGNILNAINHMRQHIGLERALKLLTISRTQYNQWLLESRFNCFDSFAALCTKRHPHQLEFKEIKRMKKMLLDPELDHWPIVSVAGVALRKKSIVASLYSWYKYARLFNIKRKTHKKDRKTIGLIATCPNEYLHVDTTYYPLVDDRSICITFVMDNFSKMILGFHVADKLSFDVVKQSLANALKVIATHPDQQNQTPEMPPQKNIVLVADGGRENHNKKIDEFISKLSGRKITKIRALKDIRFSNSPVEAVHRTIKGRYLRGHKFASVEAVSKFLEWAVMDYNTLRPHYKHKPRTPHEVYFNIPLWFDLRKRTKKAMKDRVKRNKFGKCTQCADFRSKKECSSKTC